MTLTLLINAFLLGVGATIVMDLWALFSKLVLKLPSLSFPMVGRWIGHLLHGQLIHRPINKSAKIPAEAVIGWSAHYAIGIIFAFMFLFYMGENWLTEPAFWPAFTWGIITVVAPYFILQPAMGAGIAARFAPNPTKARCLSLLAHAFYGIGIYLSGLLLTVL